MAANKRVKENRGVGSNVIRVSIFVDHDNLVLSYERKNPSGVRSIGRFKSLDDSIWSVLTKNIVGNVRSQFFADDPALVRHVGTYVCIGFPRAYTAEVSSAASFFNAIDCQNGLIVKYGTRAGTTWKDGELLGLGREKGVDTEIVCQMLMGAFEDHYDLCVLMSDDADYLPAVARVQDIFGKRVIQAGFLPSLLRASCYGHIPLEYAGNDLKVRASAR